MVAQPDILQSLKDYATADLDVFFGLPAFDYSWSMIFSVEGYAAACGAFPKGFDPPTSGALPSSGRSGNSSPQKPSSDTSFSSTPASSVELIPPNDENHR